MKNKVLFIALALVLALSLVGLGCPDDNGPVAPTEVKVGLVVATSGDLEVFDQMAFGPARRAWIQENPTVYLSEWDVTVPINVVTREWDSDRDTLEDLTIGLMVTDNVDFIWGAPGTDCIYIQAPVCEERGYVLFTAEGGATVLYDDAENYNKLFVNLSFSSWYQLPVMAAILEEELDKDPGDVEAYVIHTAAPSLFGLEYLATAKEHFTVVQEVAVSPIPDEMDPVPVVTAMASYLDTDGFDLLLIAGYPFVNFPLVGVMSAFGVDPPAVLIGPGGNFGFFAAEFGANATGIMSFTVANIKTDGLHPESSTDIMSAYTAIAELLEDEMGLPEGVGMAFIDFWGHPLYWAALDMWKAALVQAGDVDNNLLRAALAATDDENPITTILGDTWYDFPAGKAGAGFLSYKCHTGSIGQWQYDEVLEMLIFETIGYTGVTDEMPNYVATSAYIPMEGLWNWLP